MTVNAAMHAMIAAAEREWQLHAPGDLTLTDFQRWPRGFHRSGWVVAGYIGCNPFDVLGKPTPAARAVNALLTRQCVVFTIAMITNVADPGDADEPLLTWFNQTVHEHQHQIAATVEAIADTEWQLPKSRPQAARRLINMWQQGGIDAFAGSSFVTKWGS